MAAPTTMFLMVMVATTMLCVFIAAEEITKASGSTIRDAIRMGIRCMS